MIGKMSKTTSLSAFKGHRKGDVQLCHDICPDQHFYTR